MTSIWIGIALGVITVITGGLAGHLATENKVYRWLFWSAALVSVVLLIVQGITIQHENKLSEERGRQAEKREQENQQKLVEIEKNTKQPPVVNVPPFPTPSQHSHLLFLDPDQPAEHSFSLPFKQGEQRFLNIRWKNSGDYFIKANWMNAVLLVVPIEDRNIKFSRTIKTIATLKPRRVSGAMAPKEPGHYYTFAVPSLTDADIADLNDGKSDLCVVGRAFWEDGTGKYTTDHFECLHQGGGVFNWHDLEQNNRELKG